MADTLSSEIKASCGWILRESLDLSTVVDSARLEYSRALADGAGTDQAAIIWHDQRGIAAGGTDDLDLSGGLSNTIFGTPVVATFSCIKAILIVNTAVVTGCSLQVGGGPNAFTPPFVGSGTALVEVGPDSPLLLANKKDGWIVTAGTGDILRIHNPSLLPIAYKIAILGS
jgi:hypothetical protein